MRLTIARKLLLGYGSMIILILAVGYFGAHSVVTGRTGMDLMDRAAEIADLGATGIQNILLMRLHVTKFTQFGRDGDIADYERSRDQFRAALTGAGQKMDKPEWRERNDAMLSKADEYDRGFEDMKRTVHELDALYTQQFSQVGSQASALIRKASDDEIGQSDPAEAQLYHQLLNDFLLVRVNVMKYLHDAKRDYYEVALKAYDQTALSLQTALSNEQEPEHRARGEEIQALLALYRKHMGRSDELIVKRDNLITTMAALAAGIVNENQQLVQLMREQNEATTSDAARKLDRSSHYGIAITVFAVVLGLVLGLFNASSIIRPLRAIVTRLQDIAQGEGDLTQRVDEQRKDELGELGRWFNLFVKKMHDVVSDVAQASREVASAAIEIAASSEEMARGMAQQTDQTTQVSAAVEQMSATVVEVARKSIDASGTAEEAGRHASEGGTVVRRTVEGMKSISEVVNQSAAAVLELGRRGEQIDQIIGVINDIADQTNLLALNAAIEAARAGEHGRGFAVVADEVRKLAERTTRATKEVAESIKAIQHDTSTAVERMQAGTERVNDGVELAESAGAALRSIVDNAENVAIMIRSIAAASEQQSDASGEISRNVELITAVTRQASEGASQAASAAAHLSDKAEQLQNLISQFKLAKS